MGEWKFTIEGVISAMHDSEAYAKDALKARIKTVFRDQTTVHTQKIILEKKED